MRGICWYGNCHETATPISVNIPSWGRLHYCCELHAAAGLFDLAIMRASSAEQKTALLEIKPALVRVADGR